MFVNIPLITDWHLITTNREQFVNEQLCPSTQDKCILLELFNLSVQQTMHPLTAVPYWKGVEMTCIALLKQLSCALKPAITIDASLLATSAIPATAASDDDATNKDHFSSSNLVPLTSTIL
eukprot:scaffold17475_cov82-Skeletonema_dohrnii-CCMP3373.AAC.1